jgi:hypothetical protein
MIRCSASSASIKGEVNLSGGGFNARIANNRMNNNSAIVQTNKMTKFAKNNNE